MEVAYDQNVTRDSNLLDNRYCRQYNAMDMNTTDTTRLFYC